jgi:hypothetical protein
MTELVSSIYSVVYCYLGVDDLYVINTDLLFCAICGRSLPLLEVGLLFPARRVKDCVRYFSASKSTNLTLCRDNSFSD